MYITGGNPPPPHYILTTPTAGIDAAREAGAYQPPGDRQCLLAAAQPGSAEPLSTLDSPLASHFFPALPWSTPVKITHTTGVERDANIQGNADAEAQTQIMNSKMRLRGEK